jgi:hypothetical protein
MIKYLKTGGGCSISPDPSGRPGLDICIAPKLITEPKASHIQIIPGISTPEPITFAPGKIFSGPT